MVCGTEGASSNSNGIPRHGKPQPTIEGDEMSKQAWDSNIVSVQNGFLTIRCRKTKAGNWSRQASEACQQMSKDGRRVRVNDDMLDYVTFSVELKEIPFD